MSYALSARGVSALHHPTVARGTALAVPRAHPYHQLLAIQAAELWESNCHCIAALAGPV